MYPVVIFSVAVLQKMRATQLDQARRKRDARYDIGSSGQSPTNVNDLQGSLAVWDSEPKNADENFWHHLFENVPALLAAAIPGDTLQLGSKCYVGGKNVFNGDGNVVDFLYATRSTANVTLDHRFRNSNHIRRPYRA